MINKTFLQFVTFINEDKHDSIKCLAHVFFEYPVNSLTWVIKLCCQSVSDFFFFYKSLVLYVLIYKGWLVWLSFQIVASSLTVFHEIILELHFLALMFFLFFFLKGELLDFFVKLLHLLFSILNFNLFVSASFKVTFNSFFFFFFTFNSWKTILVCSLVFLV